MKRRCGKGVSLVIAALLFCPYLHAQVNSWQPIGPEGGNIAGIAQDPQNSNVLYAVIDEYPTRMFASTDHGNTWSLRGTAETQYSAATVIMIDRTLTSTMYLGGNGSLFKSTDSGQHWSVVPNPQGISYWGITMDPSASQVLHAIGGKWENSKTYPAYHRSTNAGTSWTTTKVTTSEGSPTMMTAAGNVVFVTVYDYQSSTYALYKSTDGGNTFNNKTGTIAAYMTSALVDPAAPSRVWVATGAGVYRSTNGGDTWTLNDGYIYSVEGLYLKPGAPSTVYASGYSEGVFVSTDGGATWTLRTNGLYGNAGLGMVVEPAPSNILFSARNAGIFRSSDGGQNWQPCYSGIAAARVVTVRMAPSQPSVVYSAVDDDALYKSTGIGNTLVSWQRLGNFMHCGYVNDIAVSPTDAGKAYAVGGT